MEAAGVGGECTHRLPFGHPYYGPGGRPCGRFVCTPETPHWSPGQGRAIHPYAEEVPDSQHPGWPGGDTVWMKCPVCGTGWKQELPQ